MNDALGQVERVATRHRALGAPEHALLDVHPVQLVLSVVCASVGLLLAHIVQLAALCIGQPLP